MKKIIKVGMSFLMVLSLSACINNTTISDNSVNKDNVTVEWFDNIIDNNCPNPNVRSLRESLAAYPGDPEEFDCINSWVDDSAIYFLFGPSVLYANADHPNGLFPVGTMYVYSGDRIGMMDIDGNVRVPLIYNSINNLATLTCAYEYFESYHRADVIGKDFIIYENCGEGFGGMGGQLLYIDDGEVYIRYSEEELIEGEPYDALGAVREVFGETIDSAIFQDYDSFAYYLVTENGTQKLDLDVDESWGIVAYTDDMILGRAYEYINESRLLSFNFHSVDGECIISGLEDAQPFSEGFACVKQNGKWGVIDKTGKYVVACKFDGISSMTNGEMKFIINHKIVNVDKRLLFLMNLISFFFKGE